MPESAILIVDSESRAVERVRASLEAEGFRLLICDDGEAALDLARREHPALILLGLSVAGVDSWAILKSLECDSRTAAIPVVLLTRREDDPYILRGLEMGAIDSLAKPVDRARLVELIWRVLEEDDLRAREERRRQLMAERRRRRRSLDQLF